jgi:CBS domain-containing protein
MGTTKGSAAKGSDRDEGSGLISVRAPERARLKIAHVLVADGLQDVELGVDCPSCRQNILLDVADVHALRAAFGWDATPSARPEKGHAPHGEARERHIESVMRTDVPAVSSATPIGLLPELFESTGAACVVLVDDDERPLAVASPLDLFREVGTHGPTSIAGLKLLDVAKTRVLYLRTDTRVSSALRVFAEQNPDYIVVVGPAGKLAGVVSPSDLLAFLTR